RALLRRGGRAAPALASGGPRDTHAARGRGRALDRPPWPAAAGDPDRARSRLPGAAAPAPPGPERRRADGLSLAVRAGDHRARRPAPPWFDPRGEATVE